MSKISYEYKGVVSSNLKEAVLTIGNKEVYHDGDGWVTEAGDRISSTQLNAMKLRGILREEIEEGKVKRISLNEMGKSWVARLSKKEK